MTTIGVPQAPLRLADSRLHWLLLCIDSNSLEYTFSGRYAKNPNLNLQAVAVEAMKQQCRELVYRTVQLDPLTAAVCTLGETRQMVDELFEAHEADLPF